MSRDPGPFNIVPTVTSMFGGLWHWLKDMFYAFIFLAGPFLTGAFLLFFVVWATGLHRVLF